MHGGRRTSAAADPRAADVHPGPGAAGEAFHDPQGPPCLTSASGADGQGWEKGRELRRQAVAGCGDIQA